MDQFHCYEVAKCFCCFDIIRETVKNLKQRAKYSGKALYEIFGEMKFSCLLDLQNIFRVLTEF